MKIIETGTTYKIYGEDLIVLDNLPPQTYRVGFGQFTGFFLEKQHELEVKEDKVYGIHNQKVDKVLKRFADSRKNLGVILSGDKGIGKSLFARLLANKAVDNGIPVILVDRFIPGISDFLNEIKNEVMVLFDEFDKTFAKNGDDDPQAKMLSLFDGTSDGKKLFVVTCNDYYRLNEFMVNRPGRFHFHFRFDYPNSDEVKEYLTDKLDEKFYSEIKKVVAFSRKRKLNYDCLSAIAVEINEGELFEEAIKDLNIINTRDSGNRYDVKLYTEDGIVLTRENECIDLLSGDNFDQLMYDSNDDGVFLTFKKNCAAFDSKTGTFVITRGNFKTKIDEDYIDNDRLDKFKKFKFSCVRIIPVNNGGIHYNLAI